MNIEETAIKALKQIKSPILFMQQELKDGEQLNGSMAILLCNDANYLRSIAEKALTEIESTSEQSSTVGVEEKAQRYSQVNYMKAPLQSQEDAEYIQAVSFHSFLAGYAESEGKLIGNDVWLELWKDLVDSIYDQTGQAITATPIFSLLKSKYKIYKNEGQ